MNCTRPGKQLVRKAVQQEELKFLKTTLDTPKAIQQDSTVADLPDLVRQALLGMPHTNSRTTSKKWLEYYTQESLDRTYEMYQHDFEVFGYSPIMTQRPDLQPPASFLQQHAAEGEETLSKIGNNDSRFQPVEDGIPEVSTRRGSKILVGILWRSSIHFQHGGRRILKILGFVTATIGTNRRGL
jgi:hypothetical protein